MKKSDEMKPDAQGCLGKAQDDEMLFILRAQDGSSPKTVLFWIGENFENCPDKKLREAFECALEMKKCATRKIAD